MGQSLLCNTHIDKEDFDRTATFIGSFRGTFDKNRQSFKNVCKEFGIGQYMNSNQKISSMWKELYGIVQLLKIQDEDQGYEELKHDLKESFPFITNEQDEIITSLWILDKKGFNYLISLGPPVKYRWSSWKVLLLNSKSKAINYETQLCQANDSSRQISLDVQRTLVTHKFFKDANFGQEQLLRILNAIAITFPQLGYCQGMNFLAGFFLIISGCDERLGFECFIELLISPKYLLYFCYSPKLPFLHLLTYVTHQLFKDYDQQLFLHFKKQQIPDSFWLTKMIMSLFLYVLPSDSCIRIWDYIIAYGFLGLLEVIISFMYFMRDELLLSDIERVGDIFIGQFNRKEKNIDIEQVISFARKQFKIKRKTFSLLTKQFIADKQQDDQFYEVFTDFEDEKLFNEKMNSYINSLEL